MSNATKVTKVRNQRQVLIYQNPLNAWVGIIGQRIPFHDGLVHRKVVNTENLDRNKNMA